MSAPVAYTVTWLEMTSPPAGPPLPAPLADLSLRRVRRMPLHFFLYLYRAVGAPYEWTDRIDAPREHNEALLGTVEIETWVLYAEGVPAGFFMLDRRVAGVCELMYFGLVQGYGGRGYGRWLLDVAVREAWEGATQKVIVDTCTLDHPAALPLYQRAGFVPVRRAVRQRVRKGRDYLGALGFGWP